MKKLISVITVAILIVLLSSSSIVFASTATYDQVINNPEWQTIYMICPLPGSPQGSSYTLLCRPGNISVSQNGSLFTFSSSYAIYSYIFSEYPPESSMAVTQNNAGYYISYSNVNLVLLKGSNQLTPNEYYFNSLQDYENYINPPTPTPSPTPTPIPNMWDKFYEWYYNLYGYYPADDSLFGYFRSLFEEDAESSGSGGPSQHSISTHRPAPTPTPTPIPYSVSIVPVYDNNGNVTNYIYNYTYTSESGDTILATSPPEQPNSNNTNVEPYNPDPLTVPTSSLDAWYMFAYDENEHPNPELQNPNVDFGTGMKYIEDNIDDYDRPIDYIMSVINAFPDDWLMLFGIGIGLIFIAGIISRFLS